MKSDTNKLEKLAGKVAEETKPSALVEMHTRSLVRREKKIKALADSAVIIADMRAKARLQRPDGVQAPDHCSIISIGQHVAFEGYAFQVIYVGDSIVLLEPVGPVIPREFNLEVGRR